MPINISLLFREQPTFVFQLCFHLLKFLKALPLYMLLLSSTSNKDVLFIFSANKVAAEEVPMWVPLEQKVVKDAHRSSTSTTSAQIESSWTRQKSLPWSSNLYSRQLEVLWTIGCALDNWRYSGQLEVFWTTGGTLDNWRCSRQLGVLWTTGGVIDNWRYFGQLKVLSTTEDALDNCR